MAQSKTGNRVTVAGTVTPELFDFIDEQHWKLRKTRSEVVGDVLLEWAQANGFEQPETGEVEQPDAEPDAEPAEPVGAAPARTRATRAK